MTAQPRSYLSLKEAMESGRLPDFIAQEEERLADYAPADRKEVEKGIEALIKTPAPKKSSAR